ncbi:flavodoxin-dependent (E)-4-hydroxy-3-methylbut-2-enyl-diphosphate synthase [Hydrogenoanaerobacterium sp.]|uniref:flavodoxin-dependent (E)-4-hydroxy-3-methylbut-2-enyl-diphosphate synthase n=1 Tax=Hydrogenoanaerobacterium sp. TaxID=2953763 RepID=UPI00289FE1D7|nr:flavodoxin-dependent (E)-4-hydroxy-3-methylbut-2-enyl-diphosphate synthase [Hydrogenoanaerobacterium sp.]
MLHTIPSRQVNIGGVTIGGGAPIAIQSMLSVPAADIAGNIAQAIALEQAGCQILRVAIPNHNAVALIPAIKENISIPLVADIHFDYRLALESVAAGIDKIRINPGNIGDDSRVKQVVDACRAKNIPIRIGVNSGSVEKEILAKHGSPTVEALLESAQYHIGLLQKYDFDDIVVSIKASDVPKMIAVYRAMAQRYAYPLHLGVTEAGTERMGLIKSAIGIGSLLCDGIGDTIRVSLTADPVKEITAAQDILRSLGLYRKGVRFISCPTCGRTSIDLIGLANRVEQALAGCDKDISVAIMGCIVNGPGEAREADIGIAGGVGEGLLFKKGKALRKIPEAQIVDELLREIEKM